MSRWSKFFEISMWIMEFFVLALIAYEVLPPIWSRRQRKNRLTNIVKMMQEGQELQRTAPLHWQNDVVSLEWVERVARWKDATVALLASYSSQAIGAFQNDPRNLSPDNYSNIQHRARDCFANLMQSLSNLRRIMENMEVYC
jgi:hypothetical protein